MKITEKQLRKVIKESIQNSLNEAMNAELDRVCRQFGFEGGAREFMTKVKNNEIPRQTIFAIKRMSDMLKKQSEENYMWNTYGNKNVGHGVTPGGDESYDLNSPGTLAMCAMGDDDLPDDLNRTYTDYAQSPSWASPKGDFRTRK